MVRSVCMAVAMLALGAVPLAQCFVVGSGMAGLDGAASAAKGDARVRGRVRPKLVNSYKPLRLLVAR